VLPRRVALAEAVLRQTLAAAGCISARGLRRRPGMSRTDRAATIAPAALMRKAISKPAFWGSPLARMWVASRASASSQIFPGAEDRPG